MPKTLRRIANTEVEAVQFNPKDTREITNFAADNIDFEASGQFGHVYGREVTAPQLLKAGDWVVKDTEGYYYVLADSLKQRIYEEVE